MNLRTESASLIGVGIEFTLCVDRLLIGFVGHLTGVDLLKSWLTTGVDAGAIEVKVWPPTSYRPT